MNKIYKLALIVAVVFNLYGCARTLPLVSHAHVGHALTSWHDTPNQVGLYVSARNEANEALKIATDHLNLEDAKQQKNAIKRIAYLLNPDVVALNDAEFGKRYGVLRALEGVLDHIEYAATSEDTSLNLLSSINNLTKDGELVLNNFKQIFKFSQQTISNADANSRLSQLHKDLKLAVNGKVENGVASTYGMQNFTDDFNAMLKREQDPRYEPLPRKFVLGLVRLPNGHWGYQLNSGTSKYDSDDYY